MTVKIDAERSRGSYTLIEFTANHGFGSPRHFHEHEDEAFYILDGSMRVMCGTKTWEASVGSTIFLPKGVEHAVLVTSETPVRALQITNPAGFEDFIGELGRRPETAGIPAPTMPDIPRMEDVGRRTGRIVVGPPLTL